jgi:hypothetical protein
MVNPCIIGGTYGAKKAVHGFAINTILLKECKNGINGLKYFLASGCSAAPCL